MMPTSKAMLATTTPGIAQRQPALMPMRKPGKASSRNIAKALKSSAASPGIGEGLSRHVICRSTMGFVSNSDKGSTETSGTSSVDVSDLGQTGSLTFFSAEGTNEKLDLILSFIDKDNFEIAPVDTESFQIRPWVSDTDGEVLGSKWSGEIIIPNGARTDLVVLRVRPDGKDTAEYINKIEIMGSDDFSAEIVCNSWIHRSNGGRIFFASNISLPTNATPKSLQPWRAADLAAIRGSMQERAVGRSDWDRIYDWDVYNDLAPPEEDRPILGGNERYPYPRRVRTGRPRVPSKQNNNILYESRAGVPFVPLNEKFNTRKEVNFNTYTLLSLLPVVGQTLRQGILSGFQLRDFGDVDALFAKLREEDTTLSDKEIDKLTHKEKPWWLIFPKPEAFLGSVKAISGMVGGGVKQLLKFPAPLVWKNRPGIWKEDVEWGRQALAGVNPSVINAVTDKKQLGAITEAHLKEALKGVSLDELLAQSGSDPRLLVIDYTPVFEEYAEKITKLSNLPKAPPRVGYSGRLVLFRRDDEQWAPVAIELKESGDKLTVYTPSDPPAIWLLAKGVFTSIDCSYHQLVTHWLRTHACTEPYIISMRRNLSELHPVFKLLAPHTAFTMQINANARANLVGANGIVERVFTPGKYALRMSAEVYKKLWRFESEALPADLIKRGLAKRQEDGSLKLLLKDYPYADDGILLWNAIEKWVGSYLSLYFNDKEEGKKVTDDDELVAWWKEIVTVGHKDIKEGWPAMETVADLTQILTTMIWMASCHHAAINFSQYPFCAYALNRPTFVSKKIPAKGSREYEEITKDNKAGEKAFVENLVGFQNLLLNNLTVELLSTHADNEVYIGEENHMYITEDRALALYKNFTDEIKSIEDTINKRNSDPTRKMRKGDKVIPYTTLMPTSGRGITNRGIPQSISI